jgi:predicted  nucleic acid-binding Zn-ribbon protein
MSLKVERATLNMQAAQTQQAELKQELAAWKNLSDKEEEEVDGLRKAKVDLEVRVRAAEGRAKEAEKKDKESMKTLEKERKKSASLAREVERLEACVIFD